MLTDFQRAWGLAVRTGKPPGRSFRGCTLAERTFLEDLAYSDDFRVTLLVQRSWCEHRTRSAARLTLAALPQDQGLALIAKWLARGGGTSSFSASEADELLEFIARRLSDPSPALTLCRMEQAVHRASLASATFVPREAPTCDPLLARARGAAIVHLGGELSVLFAPGLADLHREATGEEIELWRACENPLRLSAAVSAGHSREGVTRLIAAGALEAR
jgi:hypothetical protein